VLNGEATQPAFQRADQWYFRMLRAELENRGQGEAMEYIHDLLRLVPASSDYSPEEGGLISFTLEQRVTEYEVRLDSQTGEQISWFADFLASAGDRSMPEKDALILAEKCGRPPRDAELEVAGYESMAERTYFRARWIHRLQGLEVEGDYIEVLINGAAKVPFSVSRFWREPNLTSQPRIK
jgi:hypothetical protein